MAAHHNILTDFPHPENLLPLLQPIYTCCHGFLSSACFASLATFVLPSSLPPLFLPSTLVCLSWDSGSGLGDFDGHSQRVLSCAFRPIRPFRVFSAGEDFQVNYYEGPPFRFKASNK